MSRKQAHIPHFFYIVVPPCIFSVKTKEFWQVWYSPIG
jgi:hypothetical protein